MSELDRGETQQLEFLRQAAEKIESAIECHEAGMMDPALADADTASGHLRDYRKGPIPQKSKDGSEVNR